MAWRGKIMGNCYTKMPVVYEEDYPEEELRLSIPMSEIAENPQGLGLVCRVAIVLGVLGIFSSLGSLFFLTQLWDSATVSLRSGMPDGYHQAQLEIAKRLRVVQERYVNLNTGLLAIDASLSICFIAAGFMCMRCQFNGRSLLLWVFLFVVGFEAIRLIIHGFMATDVLAVLSNMAMDIKTNGFGNEMRDKLAALDAVKSNMMFSGLHSVLLTLFAIAEAAFCIVGFRYLQQPDIRDLFPEPVRR